ncbi:MAG: substrate-binding periplasmic protein [Aestuariibacter sp.]
MLIRVILTALILQSLPVPAEPPEPNTITIATGETPPYTSQNIKHMGYMNHVVSRAFSKVGIQTTFVFMPWSRAYLEAKQGSFAATSYWFSDPRHKTHFYFSKPLSEENTVFFKRRVSLVGDWNNFDDVRRKQLKMGLTRGYTYTQETWRYAESRPDLVSIVNTDMQNLKMLMLKRIDAFPIEEVTGWYILNKHFPQEQVKKLEIADEPLMTKSAHLFFPKSAERSQYYLERFNQGLTEMAISGELESMYEDLVLGEYH